jgi:signal transduction histidine kinase
VRSRWSLRTRLVVAIVSVALGVLGISYVATYALVRRSLQQNALSSLRNRSTDLADLAQNTNIATNARVRRLALRLTDLRLVAIRADGTLASGVNGLGSLPDGLTIGDLRPTALLQNSEVSGRIGSTVFLAIPTDRYAGQARVVVVATDTVDMSVLRRLFPLLLIVGLIVLVLALVIANWLARRLTRPIGEIERAAQQLATGDLTARAHVPDSSDDELAALAGTLNDMASQLDAARGSERAFLMSVSHDLRTPLTSIRGYAEALADGTLDDADPAARRRAATVIGSEARRLERLVRDLLDLSRLDSHQFSLSPRECNATDVVRDTATAFAPQAGDLGVTLTVLPGPVLTVELDADRLAQIVANLVENALKYAATRVDVYVSDYGDGQIAVVVGDDGPGIPPDRMARVFDRLYTVRETPGRSVGTGLGLAIVRELSAAMGGRAWVDAPEGGGTRFVVALPRTHGASR